MSKFGLISRAELTGVATSFENDSAFTFNSRIMLVSGGIEIGGGSVEIENIIVQ